MNPLSLKFNFCRAQKPNMVSLWVSTGNGVIPYTLGYYVSVTGDNSDGFYCYSYIFKQGYGTASEQEEFSAKTEAEAQEKLIHRALTLIFRYYSAELKR